MFKLANQVLDAYDDVGRTHLRKIAQLNPKIYVMTSDERKQLDDSDFALSVITKKAAKLNKFPVDTHDNAWLSNQYFQETFQRMPKTAQSIAAYHIKQACERFKIEPKPAVVGLAKEASSNIFYEPDMTNADRTEKVASVNLEKFAEVERIGDNYTFAQYVFATPAHVKMAAKYFDEFSDKMPLDTRHKYAAAIQKRAGELGMEKVKGKVVKYASDHYSAHVDAHITSRKSLLEVAEPKYVATLDKIASMKKEMPPVDFAKLLHGFDKRAGLERYYGSYLTNPYEATFANQPDQYAGWRTKIAGMTLTHDQIAKVATEKYAKIKDYFGKDVADCLRKEGVPIFESLPMDAKEVIASMANGEL